MNGARYLDMLKTKLYPDLSEFALNNPDVDPSSWMFMKDGARPHITLGVRNFLHDKFGAVYEQSQHVAPI